MADRKETGRWPEFADATGIDAKYIHEKSEADRQLKEATAGPEAIGAQEVARGDTEMKNPHGSFATPSPHVGILPKHPMPGLDGQSNRTPDGFRDPEGQQGGTIRQRNGAPKSRY